MNPIPVSWCLGGAGVAALLGAWGGWTVRDWKADSEALVGLQTAITTVEKQRKVIDDAAGAYEKDQADDALAGSTRVAEIRTVYRDRVVSPDCAAPPTVSSLLGQAVSAANARAAGQPPPGLPTATHAANTAD